MYKLNGSNLRVMLHAASEECGDDMEILELVKKNQMDWFLENRQGGCNFFCKKGNTFFFIF